MEELLKEAKKCLSCKVPFCEKGCPIHNPIRDILKLVKEEKYHEAARMFYENSCLSFICSKVCAVERQCEGNCVLNKINNPVKISRIEELLSSYQVTNIEYKNNGKKVLVIGAGPSGITAALELRKKGFIVDLFEKNNYLGGLLLDGIPSERVNKEDIVKLEKLLEIHNVNIFYNKELLEEDIIKLSKEYTYVFIACGLGKSKHLGLKESNKVIDALKLLKAYNLKDKLAIETDLNLKGKAIVIGAGNVAMDASIVLRHLGVDTKIVYRRSLEESPANKVEIEHVKELGVNFKFLYNPVEIVAEDNEYITLKVEKMILGEPDESGRRRPIGTKEYEEMKVNYLIEAIGQSSELSFDILKNDYGYLVVNNNYQTSIENIYAIGDITLGASSVVKACESAKKAVNSLFK